MKAIDLREFTSNEYIECGEHIDEMAKGLASNTPTFRKQALDRIVDRVTLDSNELRIIFTQHSLMPEGCANQDNAYHKLIVPFHTKRRGVESKMIIGNDQSDRAFPDHNLI